MQTKTALINETNRRGLVDFKSTARTDTVITERREMWSPFGTRIEMLVTAGVRPPGEHMLGKVSQSAFGTN
jgi:hypothetical protein